MRRAKGFALRASSDGPRGEERRAKCYAPRAKSQVLRAKCSGQKPDGSHPADLGFETRCGTPIESRGRASQFPWGRGCARSRRAVFPSPRGGRGGYPFYKKNKIFQVGIYIFFFLRLIGTPNSLLWASRPARTFCGRRASLRSVVPRPVRAGLLVSLVIFPSRDICLDRN